MRVSDIAIDPINPNTMYISLCDFEYIDVSLKLNGRKRNTHYGLGLYKTTGIQIFALASVVCGAIIHTFSRHFCGDCLGAIL